MTKTAGYRCGIVNVVFLFLPLAILYYLAAYRNMDSLAGTSVKIKPWSNRSETHQERDTTACYKPNNAISYKICKRLPFTEIKCGAIAEKRQLNENGTRYKVPNIVHVVWFGVIRFRYYQYLALRSVASIQQPEKIIIHYSRAIPSGLVWDTLVKEIPCLEFHKMIPPSKVLGVKISNIIAKTDAARIEILLKYGGIYIDSDVIMVKRVDTLRQFSVTLGRSIRESISMGVVIAEPGATFLQAFYEQYPTHFRNTRYTSFTTRFLMQFYKENIKELDVHIEETSIQRPNPYRTQDGGTGATTLAHFDLSENYFLHIHPSQAIKTRNLEKNFMSWTAEKLRKVDIVYGEAARIALFGSSDLVFKPWEKAHNRIRTKKIQVLEPIETMKLLKKL